MQIYSFQVTSGTISPLAQGRNTATVFGFVSGKQLNVNILMQGNTATPLSAS